MTIMTDTENIRIFLAGPPFSGKTSTGSRLAELLRIPFIDLDGLIEEKASLDIPRIFAGRGEDGFRDLESLVLRESIAGNASSVTALGGGCLLRERNLRLVAGSGRLVALTASMDTLLKRRELQSRGRPLASSEEDLRRLMMERKAHYDSLPEAVDTSRLSPDQAARAVLLRLGYDPPE
jgi:shikimate kinase